MEHLNQIFKQQIIRSKQVVREKNINADADVKELYSIFKKVCYEWSIENKKDFIIDPENLPVIQALTLYFAGHPSFEDESNPIFRTKPSLDKGITICGNVGSGKTLIMELFKRCFNKANKYSVVPCDTIADNVRKEGVSSLDRFYNEKTSMGFVNTIMFDDLGIENKAKYYGDTINTMFDVIIKRHRLFTQKGIKTHFTTNLSPGSDFKEWVDLYDTRTASRIKEMSNVIVLGGSVNAKDRRI